MQPHVSASDALARRVARLERANVRLRRTLWALAIAVVSLPLTAQVLPGGRLVEGDGLVLRDATGHERVVVRVDTADTTLRLRAPTGEDQAVLTASGDGSTTLRLVDRGGKGGVELGVHFDGSAVATLVDRTGTRRGTIALDGFVPSLQLVGMRGSAAVDVPGDGPRLTLLDEKSQTLFRAPPASP
jgi:hypothetical protein